MEDQKPTSYRYRILALLFFATTINYMDRSVIGVLAPTLQYKVFNWTDNDYANINIAFKIAYALGMLTMGAIIDKFGTRIGYTISIAIWSISGMLHAAIRPAFSVVGFMAARFGLGFGESGNFPAAVKTVAEWFPKKQRAFATGIFNAGTNVGAILAPIVIPMIVSADGGNWQVAFLITGAFSAIWVFFWVTSYRKPEEHPKVNAAEVAYIHSDTVAEVSKEKIPWSRVLPLPQTWAFAVGKLTDAAWWFYLFWGGKFLYDSFGLDIKRLALPLVVIYLISDFGSVAGGWVSGYFIKRGWTVNKARKRTMLFCALFILPVMFTTQFKTVFNVNDAFFSKLTVSHYTEEREVEVDGKLEKVKEEKSIPAPVIADLQVLKGNSYPSAKEFSTAVNGIIAKEDVNVMEKALMNSARSNNYYWIAVIFISLAAAGHQAWSANLFTLVSDVFPKKATASVVGIGGMFGAIAGIVSDMALGDILTSSGPAGYFFAFLGAGSIYLLTLLAIHILMPTMTPLDENLKPVR